VTSCLDDYRDADALDRIFVRAYQLSEGNVDVRKLVASARQQLSTLRGVASLGRCKRVRT